MKKRIAKITRRNATPILFTHRIVAVVSSSSPHFFLRRQSLLFFQHHFFCVSFFFEKKKEHKKIPSQKNWIIYTPPRKNVILVRDALSFRRGIRILWLWQKIEAWKREKNGPGVPREFVVVVVFVFFFSAQRSKGNTRNVREKNRHLILRRHSINGFVGRCDWVVRALRRRGAHPRFVSQRRHLGDVPRAAAAGAALPLPSDRLGLDPAPGLIKHGTAPSRRAGSPASSPSSRGAGTWRRRIRT